MVFLIFFAFKLQSNKNTMIKSYSIIRWRKKPTWFQRVSKTKQNKMSRIEKMAISKKSTFLFNPHETLWKWLPQLVIIFTEFLEDRIKNVDSLSMTNYWKFLILFQPDFIKSLRQCSWKWYILHQSQKECGFYQKLFFEPMPFPKFCLSLQYTYT